MGGGYLRRGVWLLAGLVLAVACSTPPQRARSEAEFREWKRTASQLRSLAFDESTGWFGRRPSLRMRWIRSGDIGPILREELLRSLPGGDANAYRDAYASLGALPRDLDLLQSLLELQQEQLVGLYSVHHRTLYVVNDPRPEAGYDPSMILVHELVHALQHQHFPASVRILQGLKREDDVVTAMASALEGDASLTMLGLPDGDGLERTRQGAERMREAMLADVEFPTGKMASVPHLLRESLIFPYAHGTVVAADRYVEGGNAGLDGMMRNPPLSTLRVRFPDDADPVEFVALPLAELARRVERRGCRVGHDNVAGVLTVEVLLEDHGEAGPLDPLLRRWSGDRFVRVDCPAGPELAWFTRWESEPGAQHFARIYARIAPSIAASAGFAVPPAVHVVGRTALVLTSGLEAERALLLEGSALRAYADWRAWVADGCFPEERCP